jgi:hypothetical protein
VGGDNRAASARRKAAAQSRRADNQGNELRVTALNGSTLEREAHTVEEIEPRAVKVD